MFDLNTLKVEIKDAYVTFEGSFESGKANFPCGAGQAVVNGTEIHFEVNEKDCLTGFTVAVGDQKFVTWIDDGDGLICPRPDWIPEDDWHDAQLKIEELIHASSEVHKLIKELHHFTYQNCVSADED